MLQHQHQQQRRRRHHQHQTHAWPALVVAICCLAVAAINAQSQNAIGAHRSYDKTSFSCTGRPAGYYADVETGCQVYHMCDGLGRQFSYSCPNTTLFQQRMLICDHWYMVNCSKAESHYAANLLIGQRDKPFVNDEEGNLRTPRPDLLDRPYAPDYSGESFRNQYKQFAAVQNQVDSMDTQKTLDKSSQVRQSGQVQGQTRWKIPPPSRIILPPAYEPQVEEETAPVRSASNKQQQQQQQQRLQSKQQPQRFQTKTTSASNAVPVAGRRSSSAPLVKRPSANQPTPASFSRKQNSKPVAFSNAPLHQRPQESVQVEHDDLGTSHSTRYNTSADFNSAELPIKSLDSRKSFSFATNETSKLINKKPIKVPSKFYEPPFLYPIYNQDDENATAGESVSSTTTAAPITSRSTTVAPKSVATTTSRATSKPTTQAGKPFTQSRATTTTTTTTVTAPSVTAIPSTKAPVQASSAPKTESRTLPAAQPFKAPTPLPPLSSAKPSKLPTNEQSIENSPFDYKVPTSERLDLPTQTPRTDASSTLTPPSKDLLPPLQDIVLYDVATTQGPPIYYEWKVPSNGLEPPKLDPPIGVDGREYPETISNYNSISGKAGLSSTPTFGIDQLKPDASSGNTYANNPFLTTNHNNDTPTQRSPASRSIKDTAQPNNLLPKSSSSRSSTPSTTRRPSATPTRSNLSTKAAESENSAAPADIGKLREELSVPDYSFPLESIGRTGYLSSDAYNSFQLKIPERRSDDEVDKLRWFGENPRCPECHPSYVVPGTCEPCFRR